MKSIENYDTDVYMYENSVIKTVSAVSMSKLDILLQALREALSRPNSNKLESSSYPMAPIAVVHSCFSTRYSGGTVGKELFRPYIKMKLHC